MTAEFVPIANIASALGMDRSNARKYCLREGFSFAKIRTAASRGQKTLALTKQDFEQLLTLRKSQGFSIVIYGVSDFIEGSSKPIVDDGWGTFYLIALLPDLAPNRIKIGFTTRHVDRLQTHRTTCPTAEIIGEWPCHKRWEWTAIDFAKKHGCESVGGSQEVFDFDDVNLLVSRCNDFFEFLSR